jgi:AhpD family alkylhydroperoxidase
VTERVAPLPRSEITPEALAHLRGVFPRADKFFADGPDAPPLPPILGLFGRHATITGPWLAYNGALLEHGALDQRTRELLILATAQGTGSTYLWDEHLRLATAAGVTPEEIDAVATGDTTGWAARDRAFLAAVAELLEQHTVSDETWRMLSKDLDERELLEALFVVGTYTCLAMVLNGVGLQPAGADKVNRP